METIEVTSIKEIGSKSFIRLNLNWYRDTKKTKYLKNLTNFPKWKTYVEKLGICVFAISDIAASTTFYLKKTNESFTWASSLALFEKNLALFGDLLAPQRYATPMLKLEPRWKVGADLDNMQVSLTNGLINWKKVNGDVEIIQDRQSQLKRPRTLDTYLKHTDNQQTVLGTQRRRLQNQTKALMDSHEQPATIRSSIDAWLKTRHQTVIKM